LVIRDVDGRVVRKIGITVTPSDRLPVPLPKALKGPFVPAIKPLRRSDERRTSGTREDSRTLRTQNRGGALFHLLCADSHQVVCAQLSCM
jgi:hypothetical protein